MTSEVNYGDLHERVWKLHQGLRVLSANLLAQEMYQHATNERNLDAYIKACFLLINTGGGLLAPQKVKQASLELISVLESRDIAAEFEPGFDDALYSRNVRSYSTCGYDNLAEAVGSIEGMNSPDLDHAVNEGIAICRRTGKTDCIACFRGYGRDRAVAADDMEMALIHARSVRDRGANSSNYHLFVAAYGEVKILVSLGDLAGARKGLEKMRRYVPDSSFDLEHEVCCDLLDQEIALLSGEEPQPLKLPEGVAESLPREHPRLQFNIDRVRALESTLSGDFDRANELLEDWDRKLWRAKHVELWFDARCLLYTSPSPRDS